MFKWFLIPSPAKRVIASREHHKYSTSTTNKRPSLSPRGTSTNGFGFTEVHASWWLLHHIFISSFIVECNCHIVLGAVAFPTSTDIKTESTWAGELCYIIKNNIWYFPFLVVVPACRKWFIERSGFLYRSVQVELSEDIKIRKRQETFPCLTFYRFHLQFIDGFNFDLFMNRVGREFMNCIAFGGLDWRDNLWNLSRKWFASLARNQGVTTYHVNRIVSNNLMNKIRHHWRSSPHTMSSFRS